MDDLKRIVATNIATLRVNAHLTQFELGEKISYSDKAVSRWERGEAVPDAYVLLQLAELFGVTVDYILREHSPEEEIPAEPLETKKTIPVNYRLIMAVSALSVWAIAIIVFVITGILGNAYWLAFIWALPVTSLVMVVLYSIWGKRRRFIAIFVSLLVWTFLLSLHLTLLSYNLWMLYLLGIPAQVIIPIAFSIGRKKKTTKTVE